jgi:hypothetical protein
MIYSRSCQKMHPRENFVIPKYHTFSQILYQKNWHNAFKLKNNISFKPKVSFSDKKI